MDGEVSREDLFTSFGFNFTGELLELCSAVSRLKPIGEIYLIAVVPGQLFYTVFTRRLAYWSSNIASGRHGKSLV